jgi:hypothetical protein
VPVIQQMQSEGARPVRCMARCRAARSPRRSRRRRDSC